MSSKKRKNKGGAGSDDDGAQDAFRTMFVTLSLILLAFFILLNSMAIIDKQKRRAALGSITGSFGLLSGGTSSDQKNDSKNILESSMIKKEGMMKLFVAAQREKESFYKRGLAGDDEIKFTFDDTKGELHIILSDRLLFPPGTSILSPMLFSLLDKFSAIANVLDAKLEVTGHTDNRRLRKGSNWKLSIERGTVVARHMEAAGRLARSDVRASGASHYHPIADNDTEEGRAKNRRVEILIRSKKEDEL